MAATRSIARGERIERAPVIVLNAAELEAIRTTRLARYYFEWGEDDSLGAIVLGYGSLYNHSYEPNAEFEFREDLLAIDYVALRDIRAGEEITINYNNTGEHAAHPIRFDGTE
jgi:SET domain-containing protein